MDNVIKTKIIYFYESISLYKLCKKLFINYNNITYSIRYYLSKYPNKYNYSNLEELIVFLVEKYKRLHDRKLQKEVIRNLISGKKENLKHDANILNVNYKRVFELKKYGYSNNNSLLIIYFMGDILDNRISISKSKIEHISSYSYKTKTAIINELVCFYYLEKSDFLFENIMKLYQKKFNGWIKKVGRLLFYKLKYYEIEEIMIDLSSKLFDLLENKSIISNNSNQIDSFLYKTMFGIVYKKFLN